MGLYSPMFTPHCSATYREYPDTGSENNKRQSIIIINSFKFQGFIEVNCPVRITRGVQGKSVRLPIPRTEQCNKSVYYLGCKAWNDLKENVRDIIDLKEFKNNIM